MNTPNLMVRSPKNHNSLIQKEERPFQGDVLELDVLSSNLALKNSLSNVRAESSDPSGSKCSAP